MSEIRRLTLADVDRDARLQVEESIYPEGHVTIGGFGPVETGFGQRLQAPLNEAQMTEDPGTFLELTFEQALDLSTKLVTLLAERAAKP